MHKMLIVAALVTMRLVFGDATSDMVKEEPTYWYEPETPDGEDDGLELIKEEPQMYIRILHLTKVFIYCTITTVANHISMNWQQQ